MTYTIYGKAGCQPCNTAKELLQSKGLEFTYVDIMADPKVKETFLEMGFKSVPQVYQDDRLIGSLDSLKKHLAV